MKGANGIVQALGSENRMLRMKIGQLEQAQKEGMFIELLTAAAVTGLVQVKGLKNEEIAERSIEVADAVMQRVMQMSRSANEEVVAEAESAPLADEEESLIIRP